MKNYKSFFACLVSVIMIAVFSGVKVFSQIVIHSSDMPHIGDTLRVSLTGIVPAGYDQTGMDTTWNFSILEAQSQRVDSFVNVNTTPTAYYLFFGLLYGANLASPLPAIPGLPITDGFEFYKNESGSYGDMGLAYRTTGIPIIPAKYDNPDKIYQFPMAPGSTWASTASFSISLPGFGYLSRQKTRSSEVDGFGTLITPFGSFPSLRVKSMVAEHDSIYLDTLGMGFPLNRNITEYKWLGNGQGIPLLQINEEGLMVTATYRDFYRMSTQPLAVTLGPDTTVMHETTITLTADVTGGVPPYRYLWNTLDTLKSITVTVTDPQTYTVFVFDAQLNFGFAQKKIYVSYPVSETEISNNPVGVYPNPSDGPVTVTFPAISRPVFLKVINPLGRVVKFQEILQSMNPNTIDLSDLPSGIYFLQISNSEQTYSKKIIVRN